MTRNEALDIVGMLKCWVDVDDDEAKKARISLIKAATDRLLADDGSEK